jgi:hypothetical protein
MSRALKITALVVVVAGLGAGIIFLHWANARQRVRVAELRRSQVSAEQLRAENQKLKSFLTRARNDGAQAAEAFRAELGRVRAEVAELEQRAEKRHAERFADQMRERDALAANRDPSRGLTRLEYFHDAGQTSPSAAVETLVWAALKGGQAALERAFVLPDSARAKADAIINGLPDEQRAKWSPEKLAAMFFAGFFTEISAAEVGHESLNGPQHATVGLRATDGSKTQTIPLETQRIADDWRVVVSDRYMDAVLKKMAAADKK